MARSSKKNTPAQAEPEEARPAPAERRSWLGRVVRFVLVGGVCLGLSGALGVAGLFWYYGQDLPPIFAREDYKPPQITRILSADGHVLDELTADDGRRTVVPFDEIAPTMRDSILAAEDADFYQHQGLDYMGMVRALYYAVRYDRFQGASTITQQVVKNLILSPEKSLKRKVQEILLARRLEQHLAKDDILYIYMNHIYFGHGNYGVEEASRYFFDKPAAKLTLAESALLAGVVQSPERHSPFKHPERALGRRRYVLEQMRLKGFAGEAEVREAMEAPLGIVNDRSRVDPYKGSAPYFTSHVRGELARLLREQGVLEEGEDFAALGLRVRTTLDVEKQAAANEAVRKHLRDYDARHNLYRPVDHLAPDQLAARRREAMRKIAGDLKPQEVYLAVVTKVSAQKMTVAVGDWEGSLEPSERVNPEGRPLDQLYALGDLLRVVVSGPVARGAEVVRFSFAPGPQAALVGMDVETRHVEALVGGYDYASSNFNRATQAKRQTGSAFKPVIYAAALLEHATTPATLWDDAPFPIRLDDGKTWSPKNSDGKFLGPLPLREALALSRNVVAVRLLDRVGLEKAQQFARALGITSPLVDNLTMGLGSSEIPVLELTNAYTTFATLGLRAEPVFILSIHDAYGQPLYEAPAVEPEIALGQDIAWLTVDMMTSVLTRGTASKIGKQLKRPAAGKTGTTNEGRDAWFIGFTPQKIATAWMGYDDNTPLGKNASGGTLSAPIWLDYMQAAHRGLPSAEFPRPAVGIVSAKIDPATGLLATDEHKKAREEFFLTDTAPTEYAPVEGESTTTDFLLEQ